MTTNILRRAALFTVLVLVQATVLNHVSLWGCATPLLYVYLVVNYPHNISRAAALLWAFVLGMTADIFSNTPGMAAASLTLTAAIQPGFLNLFLQHEASKDLRPSRHSLGMAKYAFYASVLVFVHCTVFFLLESFSFLDWQTLLKDIVGSALFTLILIFAIEAMRQK